MDNNPATALNYLMEDTDSGYLMTLEQPQELETVMFYENSIGKARSDKAQETAVTPNGYVAFKGESAPYELEYCLNEGYHTGTWYQFSAQGTASKAALQMTESGWLLTADSLHGVRVKAKSKTGGDNDMTVSTDASAVLFSAGAEAAITAAVDLDGDGTFETELSDLSDQIGDVNGDSRVNSEDATEILKDAAKTGVGKTSDLSDTQALLADANGDGEVNASDATLVLVYAARVGTGYTGTLQEFMDAGRDVQG